MDITKICALVTIFGAGISLIILVPYAIIWSIRARVKGLNK